MKTPSEIRPKKAVRAAAAGLAAVLALGPATALADTGNFELAGHIYTKFMYKNDDSKGCLSLSNPFWLDNIGGSNGVCSEFELTIKGQVSKYATTGVRLQSRWGALWQDWWENGDLQPGNVEDTSGESLGMNHAQYIKLRGVFLRVAPPIPTVRWVHVGATDFGMFNEWTIGKARYIDRDNGNGVFLEGELAGKALTYHTAAIALPKLFIGPRWNTGLRDSDPLAGFWGADWAYALKVGSRPIDDLQLNAIGMYIQDWEADRYDPDKSALGAADPASDHAVALDTRFRAVNATLDAAYAPSGLDFLNVTALLAYSYNEVNPDYSANSVVSDQGFSPVVFEMDADGNAIPSVGFAGKVRAEVFDPFEVGLSAKFEYFNIGDTFNAVFGARREADVLLTDGIVGGGFIEGGQLPTLNIANEFVDFNEPWYESVIGWHGATGLLEYVQGALRSNAEYTLVTYNTNMQDRDVDNQFPDFLYTDGFTDVYGYTADQDYANKYRRGKDPRSVYKEYQNRLTHIAMLKADVLVPGVDGLVAKAKVKLVKDLDYRMKGNENDNYDGTLLLGQLGVSYQATNELALNLGYERQSWDEAKVSGSQQTGFYDIATELDVMRLGASYNFGGATATWLLEYLHKDLDTDDPREFDQRWNVWRAKATVEAGW